MPPERPQRRPVHDCRSGGTTRRPDGQPGGARGNILPRSATVPGSSRLRGSPPRRYRLMNLLSPVATAAAVVLLFAFQAWREGGAPFAAIRRVGIAGVIGGFGLVAAFAGAIYSIQVTTIANAVFLFAASPFLTAPRNLRSWAAR